MPTIQESMSRVRTLLRDPKAQQPSDLAVLRRTLSKYQAMLNSLNNTGLAWAIGEVPLQVNQGQEDYEITGANNFGKALLVESADPGNPSHIVRQIEIFNIGNLDYNWLVPRNCAGWYAAPDGSNTTALRTAFFRKEGFNSVYVRVRPVPQLSAQYLIVYEIGDWTGNAGLQSELLLPEHHDLVITRIALSILPLCDWTDDEALNSNRRKELSMSLMKDEAEYSSLFEVYKRTVAQPSLNNRHLPNFDC